MVEVLLSGACVDAGLPATERAKPSPLQHTSRCSKEGAVIRRVYLSNTKPLTSHQNHRLTTTVLSVSKRSIPTSVRKRSTSQSTRSCFAIASHTSRTCSAAISLRRARIRPPSRMIHIRSSTSFWSGSTAAGCAAWLVEARQRTAWPRVGDLFACTPSRISCA